MKGDLKKILSMIYAKKDFKIDYENKNITVKFRDSEMVLSNADWTEWNTNFIANALDETPTRLNKEGRALSELVKIMDDLFEIGYHTKFVFKKKMSLVTYVLKGDDSFICEILDVDHHDYALFNRKLVKLNKDIKKFAD